MVVATESEQDSTTRVEQLLDEYIQALLAHKIGQEILNSKSVPTDDSSPDALEFIGATDVEKVSILSKRERRKDAYTNLVSLYQDLKLAVSTKLVDLVIGSLDYIETSDFFKFAVDLLYRESQRLETDLDSYGAVDGDDEEEHSFEAEILQNVYQICTDFNQWNGQAYFIKSQLGPLFSSVNSRASFDPRPTEVHGSFTTAEVVQLEESDRAYSLGVVSSRQLQNQIPHPALPPTEITNNLVHPTKAPLPSAKWLRFNEYSSFAPVKDTSGVIVDDTEASGVWYEIFGNQKLKSEDDVQRIAQERIKELEKELDELEAMDVDKSDDASKPSSKEGNGSGASNDKAVEKENALEVSGGESMGGEIDLTKVLHWSPYNFIDDDELDAAKNRTESQLVSKLLLDLQRMQRVRLAHNDKTEFTISDEERRLALKIQNILARIVGDTTPEKLDLKPSVQLPVLQSTYVGNLPAPEIKSQSHLNRVQALRGPNTRTPKRR